MTRLPDQIDLFVQYLKTQTTWVLWFTNLTENLSAFLKVAIYWTIFGLGAHLIMRIVWVSMVGLSYAFPRGIDQNKLKYKGRFAEMVQGLPDFPRQIQHLERICSTIYAITFWKDSPALTPLEEPASESPHSTSDPESAPTP